ncbi:MAG: hypothetical protein AABX89_07545 [Candidatus Thermoplasmatota archaeon]
MRRLLSVLALMFLLPAALAQAPATPLDAAANLAASTDASPGLVIERGSEQTVNVNVELSYRNLICNQAATVDVALSLEDAGLPGVTGIAPASIAVTIPASAPASLNTGTGTATGTFRMTVAKSSLPDHDHSFTLTATTPTAIPAGCQSISPNAPAAVSKDVTIEIKTGPKDATPGSAAGGPAGTGSAASTSASKGASGFPVVVLVGALVLASLRRR